MIGQNAQARSKDKLGHSIPGDSTAPGSLELDEVVVLEVEPDVDVPVDEFADDPVDEEPEEPDEPDDDDEDDPDEPELDVPVAFPPAGTAA
mgnify:CR=1 FL=1